MLKGTPLIHGLPESLNFHGQSKCLKHLRPFTHRLIGHAPDKDDLVVRVTFESHVFSVSESNGAHDFLDEARKKRLFCPDRYAFSQGLPDQVRGILDLNVYTWEEKDKNQVANLAVLAPANVQLISGAHNVLIYYLYRSNVAGIHVEMRVKSCYMKEINFMKRPKREKIRTHVKTVCFKGGRIPKN